MKGIIFSETDSTNEAAKRFQKKARLPEGTYIQALHQSAGKGQRGRDWWDESGQSLLMTLVLYPRFRTDEHYLLNMMVTVAACRFLEDWSNIKGWRIKWPNDLYFDRQKAGGILIENTLSSGSFEHALVGIGLNLNQLEFPEALRDKTSLRKLTGRQFSVNQAAVELRIRLMDAYHREDRHDWKEAFYSRLWGAREAVRFVPVKDGRECSARIKEIRDDGSVVIDTGEAVRCIDMNRYRIQIQE